MSEILTRAWTELTASSPLEQLATVLGILGVWLMMRQSLWTFPVSLVQVAIFGWVCAGQLLYSETALQVMFFLTLTYGWAHWQRAGRHGAKPGPPVRWLTWPERLRVAGATLALWGVWGLAVQLVARWLGTGVALPWADAFVFSVSVAAQVLQARKLMDNWPGWVIANTAAVWIFWRKELWWFTVLYAVFWLMAWAGWREWHRAMKTPPAHA